LLVIQPALPPYRVDFFNALNNNYKADFYFFRYNIHDQKFNQEELKKSINFKPKYLTKGIELFGRSLRFGIKSIIKKNKPDVVLSTEYNIVTIFMVFARFIQKNKFKIFTLCDDNLVIAKKTGFFRKISRQFLIKNIDGIILTNDNVINWYNSNLKPRAKLITFPIIREENKFRNELNTSCLESNLNIDKYNLKGKKVLLFVGRLVKLKNISRLINAFNKIAKEKNDVVLAIVGSGNEELNLKNIVNRLNLNESVIFAGRKEGINLLAWYNLAQVFILPSYNELFGAVVGEALLAGCYVLCSNLAGARYLIKENVNGNTFNPYDVDEIYRAIKKSIKNITPVTQPLAPKESLMHVKFSTYFSNLLEQM